MYSVIGLLRKPESQTSEDFNNWWLQSHVPTVMQLPGLLDYRLWTVEQLLGQQNLEFTDDVPYDGIAVITFASKKAFEAAISSAEGSADNESFNKGAPSSTVLGGTQYVFRQAEVTVANPASLTTRPAQV